MVTHVWVGRRLGEISTTAGIRFLGRAITFCVWVYWQVLSQLLALPYIIRAWSPGSAIPLDAERPGHVIPSPIAKHHIFQEWRSICK